ncbi:sugar dehydrogenase complex small subunit [Candidatus Pantoea formicae]|uniref:sugar dehydrogenase complex small subunit n=1 Tax=Pantoea TaxID=53335 RepID=UPI003EDB51B4
MSKLLPLPAVAQLRQSQAGAAVLSRRHFLMYSGAGMMSLTLLPNLSTFASTPTIASNDGADFHQLCEFLTAKTLEPSLTQRAYSALSHVDDTFAQKAQQLAGLIHKGRYANIEALKVAPELTGEVKQTAMNIIASLYLGYAGTARPGHAEDDTQFVTYTQALMYRQTYAYAPIPSYSRWSTGYWTSVPK